MKQAIRIAVTSLGLSAAGFIGLALHEGYTDNAIIPIKGDVPTLGFGQTKDVKMGDKTDPIRALVRFQAEINEYESAVKRCANVPMTQYEYDVYVGMTYNIGPGAFCKSSMARYLNQGNYEQACKSILLYKKAGAIQDCSLPENAKLCGGLWKRRIEDTNKCLGGK